jgi:hypothetical protein
VAASDCESKVKTTEFQFYNLDIEDCENSVYEDDDDSSDFGGEGTTLNDGNN